MRPVVVIPTNRIETIHSFFDKWKEQLLGCKVILIIDDKDGECTRKDLDVTSYNWRSIDKELKENSWIIPRKTDCVRSFGYYMAYKYFNPLFILTLDDDVSPVEGLNVIEGHYNNLFDTYNIDSKYYSTIKHQNPRGYVPGNTLCGISHGGWLNVPDLDADVFIKDGYVPYNSNDFNEGLIPKGATYSMCGMNLAWRPELTKYMYFGLQGSSYPIDRCGDIWAGYYSKHILDTQINMSVYTGYPFIEHNKKSNSWVNLEKETNSKEMSVYFLDWLYNNKNESKYKDYFSKLEDAYFIWEEILK
jgi:hypothetical protein